jgi:hypothetical protein
LIRVSQPELRRTPPLTQAVSYLSDPKQPQAGLLRARGRAPAQCLAQRAPPRSAKGPASGAGPRSAPPRARRVCASARARSRLAPRPLVRERSNAAACPDRTCCDASGPLTERRSAAAAGDRLAAGALALPSRTASPRPAGSGELCSAARTRRRPPAPQRPSRWVQVPCSQAMSVALSTCLEPGRADRSALGG